MTKTVTGDSDAPDVVTTEYTDKHGNLVNTAGVVTRSYDCDAFGVEKEPDPLDTNHFRCCGEYLDVETGRYYLRARYYDPLIGRFTQIDPALDGINWYTYCYNNPIFYIDPTGEVVEILYEDIDGKIYNHVAIAVNDTVYSYAAYRDDSLLHLVAGEGSILVCNKENYITSQTSNGRVITTYEIFLPVIIDPFGGNCVDFVNQALDDAGIPRTFYTRQARFTPAFVYASMERAYMEHEANGKWSSFLGSTYQPASGSVIRKAVYK